MTVGLISVFHSELWLHFLLNRRFTVMKLKFLPSDVGKVQKPSQSFISRFLNQKFQPLSGGKSKASCPESISVTLQRLFVSERLQQGVRQRERPKENVTALKTVKYGWVWHVWCKMIHYDKRLYIFLRPNWKLASPKFPQLDRVRVFGERTTAQSQAVSSPALSLLPH